jgi:gliding motility-associated-like protein
VITNTCGDATASLTIAPGVPLAPVIVVDAAAGCAPFCTTLSVEALPVASNLVWDLGALGTVNAATANACFPVGTHAVNVAAAPQLPGAFCPGASAQSAQVVGWPSPEPVATGDRYLLSDDDAVVHLWDDGSGATSWSWNIGDGYVLTSGSAVDVELRNIGCYTVELTAQNVHGCTARSTTEVCRDGLEGVYLPNAFTPNGDGVNDDFRVVTNVRVLADYELAVFDRWGQVLFSTRDQGTGWDAEGTPIGVYVWKLWYTDTNGPQQRVGHVTVVR